MHSHAEEDNWGRNTSVVQGCINVYAGAWRTGCWCFQAVQLVLAFSALPAACDHSEIDSPQEPEPPCMGDSIIVVRGNRETPTRTKLSEEQT